jgi:two-component system, NtrC family, response regulator AtoC
MQKENNILIWAKDSTTEIFESFLQTKGILLQKAANDVDFVKLAKDFRGSLAILDSSQQPENFGELLARVKQERDDLHCLILANSNQDSIYELGNQYNNLDFIQEPLDLIVVNKKLHQLMGEDNLIQIEHNLGSDDLRNQNDYGHLLGMSEKMKDVMMIINQVAPTNIKVLIRGESGTGKELAARTIYARSLRRDKPFIKVLCAALPETLLESELFGYEKGAFTGAMRRKPGKFEFANHGTIFLDEIGEIDPALQAKLLQVLQDGEFSRVGGETDVKVDTRVIAATNKNLEKAVAQGSFREDLYYRLNVVSIHVPPLRERKEEIYFLIEYFLDKFNRQYNKKYQQISPETLKRFMDYDWPGNIREIENVIKRIVVLEKEDIVLGNVPVSEDQARATASSPSVPQPASGPDQETQYSLKDVGKEAASKAERELIRNILFQTHWNRKRAAEILKISYKALLYKIKKYDLNRTT